MSLVTSAEYMRIVEWVASCHKDGDLWAEKIANDLIQRADFSDFNTPPTLELSETKTASGHSETYDINGDEVRYDVIFKDIDWEDDEIDPYWIEAREVYNAALVRFLADKK